jgi:hypothetical protein
MKKYILIVIFFVLTSCSKDAPIIVEYAYNATIMKTCPGGSRITYTISKTTYDNLGEYLHLGSACESVFFKDISNISHTGYLTGIGKVSK